MCKGLLVIVHVRGPQVKGGILFSSFQNVFTKVLPIGTKLQVAACFTRHAEYHWWENSLYLLQQD